MPWPKGVPHPFESYRGRRQRRSPERWLAAFLARVEIRPDGCWLWIGKRRGRTDTGGQYGTVWQDGRERYAHRAYWEATRGPVPTGLELDHVCRNRLCVNLDHLEVVSRRENMLRGDIPWSRARRIGAQ